MKCFLFILFSISFGFSFSQDKFSSLIELELDKEEFDNKIKANQIFLDNEIIKLKEKKQNLDENTDLQEILSLSKRRTILRDSILLVNDSLTTESKKIQKDIYKNILKLKESDRGKYKKIKSKRIAELKKKVENDLTLEEDSKSKDIIEIDTTTHQSIKDTSKSIIKVDITDSVIPELSILDETIIKNSIIENEIETITAESQSEMSFEETLEKMRLAREKALKPEEIKIENSITIKNDSVQRLSKEIINVELEESNNIDSVIPLEILIEKDAILDDTFEIVQTKPVQIVETQEIEVDSIVYLEKEFEKDSIEIDEVEITQTKPSQIVETNNLEFDSIEILLDGVLVKIANENPNTELPKSNVPQVIETIDKDTLRQKEAVIRDQDNTDLTYSPLNDQDLSDLEKMNLARERAKNDKQIQLVKEEKQSNVIFENKIDTTIITNEEKETFKIITSEKVDTSIVKKVNVPKVIIKEKKKKKYSFGDVVDRNTSEKARFFLERAKLEIDKGNINKAQEYINNSIKLNPSYSPAYILKGDIFASLNIIEKAISQYHKASLLDTKNAQLFYNMGNCFLQLGKEEYAIEEWTKSLSIDSNYIMAYVGRAALFLKEKNYQAAISDYNKIFRLNTYFYPAYRGRGVAYLELGNYQMAIEDFNNYLAFEPNEPFTITKRGLAKLFDNDIFEGCTDILNASEMGYDEAKKELKKHCEK